MSVIFNDRDNATPCRITIFSGTVALGCTIITLIPQLHPCPIYVTEERRLSPLSLLPVLNSGVSLDKPDHNV